MSLTSRGVSGYPLDVAASIPPELVQFLRELHGELQALRRSAQPDTLSKRLVDLLQRLDATREHVGLRPTRSEEFDELRFQLTDFKERADQASDQLRDIQQQIRATIETQVEQQLRAQLQQVPPVDASCQPVAVDSRCQLGDSARAAVLRTDSGPTPLLPAQRIAQVAAEP